MMSIDTDTHLQSIGETLHPWTLSSAQPEGNRLDIVVDRASLLDAVEALSTTHWGFLSAITGLDHPGSNTPVDEKKEWDRLANDPEPVGATNASWLEILYHFCHGAAVLTLRVTIPYNVPSVPTICGLIPSASLYERELSEMFGIEILGAPQTEHLLLPDDWPNGVYPMRKEFTGFNQPNQETGQGKDHD